LKSQKTLTDRLGFVLTLMRPLCKRHGADTGGATWSGGRARDFICKPLAYFMWNTEDDYKLFSKTLPYDRENLKLNDQILG
jgi:hypothetical protein